MGKQKLWLIRERCPEAGVCIVRSEKRPRLVAGGCFAESCEMVVYNSLELLLGNLKLRKGQCIEITGFKVLLPKKRKARQ